MAVIRDTDPGRLLTRRAFIIGGLQASLFAILFGRLYSLQVTQGQQYQTLADENRISSRLVLPERGLILDRNGVVLARSEKNFRADLVPDQTPNIQATLKKVYGLLHFDQAEQARIRKDLRRGRSRLPVLLRDNIDWETLSLLELHTPDLPGVMIEAGEIRSYSYGSSTAHILGYMGAATEEEAKDKPLLSEPGFRIGKSGIERAYETKLQGMPGVVQLEVNAYGQQVRELAREPAAPGQELKLTLDIELQDYAQKRLAKETSASAVVMDAIDGSLYCLASQPSFDHNLFSYGISKENWAKLNSDPRTPLFNKTLTGTYAPGSTFKIVVAMAALVDGISEKHTSFCPGHLDLGNHRFHCWKKNGHGTVDMHGAIAQSCDVYFYHVSQKLGIDKISDMALRLGLGKKLDIPLAHEKPGFIPTRQWKLERFKEPWQPGETLVASIGQGYMLTTPLQLAVFLARIVNGGFAVKPQLLMREPGEKPPEYPPLNLKPAHINFIRESMIGVMAPGGTATGSRIGVEGYEMGGKTGTSQVRRISRAEHARGVTKNEDLPWEDRDHALFICFAPTEKPRYVASVVVEHGGGGSKVAAPIARELMIEIMKRDPAKVLPAPLVMPVEKPPTPVPVEEEEERAFDSEELPEEEEEKEKEKKPSGMIIPGVL
jgi:penicillin-binding protein 2